MIFIIVMFLGSGGTTTRGNNAEEGLYLQSLDCIYSFLFCGYYQIMGIQYYIFFKILPIDDLLTQSIVINQIDK